MLADPLKLEINGVQVPHYPDVTKSMNLIKFYEISRSTVDDIVQVHLCNH